MKLLDCDPLSKEVPSTAIAAVNGEVKHMGYLPTSLILTSSNPTLPIPIWSTSHFANFYFVNSHLLNVDKVGIDKVWELTKWEVDEVEIGKILKKLCNDVYMS